MIYKINITVPLVNNNGDTKQTLLADLKDVRTKLDAAIKSLQHAGGSYAHGRNYQLNPAGDSQKAYREHCERFDQLGRIAHELLEIEYAISQQGK